ncbi:hypothetical protein LIER_10924 [Lithospermum erythrorhizon]|uniref:Retrovirus-related Pol polyprotein from transposon TNT 1-94 n=1 Tax=Lithospermum erythrorhizon TaxID=34254 RepID=A0AAV3PMW5_LITER
MDSAKLESCPLGAHFQLSSKQCLEKRSEIEGMLNIPYASTVGSLMYAMICTQPDIAYSLGLVSRFLSRPRKEHWEAVKWILRYFKGTSDICICYGSRTGLQGFTDADMTDDVDSMKSTSGYVFTYAGGAISWQ